MSMRGAFSGGLMLVLAGCAGSPLTSYDLSALPSVSAGKSVHAQLVITEPLAVQALDSERILVRTDGNALAYLAGAQWPERLPEVVQARLVQSFENSHRLRRVARPGGRIVPDYQLECEIRTFELDVSAGAARVEITAKLVDDHSGKIVGTRIFNAQVPEASSEGQAVTAALDQALGDVMRQMIGWTTKAI